MSLDVRNVLFDLDGTITEPFDGITKSVQYALERFGISVPDRNALRVFIGPPLFESFSVHYGLSDADAVRAVGYYREYYADKGIFECSVYDGMEQALRALSESGKKLLVATSKPEVFAKKLIEHYSLDKYFEYVAGATLDKTRIEKAEIITYALEKCAVPPSRSVMVGDRKHDILGAKANGLKSIGVLYGYGDREELEAAGADIIVETPLAVSEAIIK